MLLEHQDVSVQGGEYRMHDCVFAHLDLRSVDSCPNLDSTIFAIVSLGNLSVNDSAVQAHTTGFKLSEIPNYLTYFDRWKRANAVHRFERGFLDFLLQVLPVRVEFSFCNQEPGEVIVSIGAVTLRGRFPQETDVLRMHFGANTLVLD